MTRSPTTATASAGSCTADESGVFVDFGTQQERIAAPYTKLTKL